MMAGTNWVATRSLSSHLSTNVSTRRSAVFLTVRIALTAVVLAACGPPVFTVSLIALLYSLRTPVGVSQDRAGFQVQVLFPGQRGLPQHLSFWL